MGSRTSSAEPEKLVRYAEVMTEQDHRLQSTSRQLRGTLERFEGPCSESGMRVSAVYAADRMRAYSNQCEPTDRWVGNVGRQFAEADQRWGTSARWAPYPLAARDIVAQKVTMDSTANLIDDVPFWLYQKASAALWSLSPKFDANGRAPWWSTIGDLGDRFSEFIEGSATDVLDQGSSIMDVARVGQHVSGLATGAFTNAFQLSGKYLSRGFRDLSRTPITRLSKWTLVGVGLELWQEGQENWQEYEGDIGRSMIGTAFDMSIGLTGSLIGGTAGAFVGGAVGSLAGPAGTVIGAKVGGIIGGYLGGRAADWVEDVKVGEGDKQLDQLVVEGAAGISENAGEAIHNTVENGISSLVRLFDNQSSASI